MTTKNIFAGMGVRTTFVNILYDELMKREFVTLADIMCIKRRLPKGFYDNNPKATLSRSEYQHGLLLTKPLHHSQKETQTFGEHDGLWYGEVTLTIEPNRELRGRILMYGEGLEVMEPSNLRKQIRDVIKKQMTQYADENNKKILWTKRTN